VKEEVEKVVSQLRHREKRVLVGKDATPTAVKSLLKKCSWVHLACHAEQNKSDPGNSCLNLYHGSLHLNTILHLQFRNPEFIFLAACETVKDDDTVINESLHLGGGFMATGFQGAIGTLWKMSDEDGPGLADAVYSRLFKNTQQPKVTEVAEALQSAVAELRSTQAPSQHWAPFIHIGV
jgi:CHAT domain-containing protein